MSPWGEFKTWHDFYFQATCVSPTTNITLHSVGLQINEHEVTVQDISSKDPKTLIVSGLEYDKDNEFVVIKLKEALQADHKYEIYIKFSGKLLDGLAGYYRSSYLDKDTKEKRWVAVTQFEATDARRAFPCFDEPAMKATFKISLGRSKNYTSISNMPLLKSEPM